MLSSDAHMVRPGLRFSELSPTSRPLVDKLGANFFVREIARRRTGVVVPLLLCSLASYVATLIALSYFPRLVGYKISGAINLAYILALAQFAVTFLIALIYALWARRVLDPLVADAFAILERTPTDGGVQ
jgi:uncharacterized membrane protein (DUF485 family)